MTGVRRYRSVPCVVLTSADYQPVGSRGSQISGSHTIQTTKAMPTLPTPPTDLRCVLLDRDGVINADSEHYIKAADEWHPLPGACQAISRLCDKGLAVAVCSNQSGVGRGLFDLDSLRSIHDKMRAQLACADATLSGIFVCPHHPDDGCHCRKPAPGLLLDALGHIGVNPQQTLFVGDSASDLVAARAAGVTPVLVRTGNGADVEAELTLANQQSDSSAPLPLVFDDLSAVADWLVRPTGSEQ